MQTLHGNLNKYASYETYMPSIKICLIILLRVRRPLGEGNGTLLLPGKSHGRRSLVGWRPWGREQSHTTERLHFHFSLSCIGEGNGNPLQCSCLENPRDRGAWWATVYGVTQSRTRLKRLGGGSKETSKNLKAFCDYHILRRGLKR